MTINVYICKKLFNSDYKIADMKYFIFLQICKKTQKLLTNFQIYIMKLITSDIINLQIHTKFMSLQEHRSFHTSIKLVID